MSTSTVIENDERMVLQTCSDSSSFDDANSIENVEPNAPLKKGPWTPAEDAVLAEYVTKHGEGNWNAVQKHTGLSRCGKSCRLRWTNHLRPDLRKGEFSPEEERLIIELHAKLGNKWARMASELPGRTDNEIKNFWNTRIKRRLKAGLPIYPPDICSQVKNDNQQGDNVNSSRAGNLHHGDFVPVIDIPNFRGLNQQIYSPALQYISSSRSDILPRSSILAESLQCSYPDISTFPSIHALFGRQPLFSGLNSPVAYSVADGSRFDPYNQNAQSFSFLSPYDHSFPSRYAMPSGLLPSTENRPWKPTMATMQLPSFQNQPSSLSPVGDAPVPPPNSGLLDSVLYQHEATRENDFPKASHTPPVAANEVNGSTIDLPEMVKEEFDDWLDGFTEDFLLPPNNLDPQNPQNDDSTFESFSVDDLNWFLDSGGMASQAQSPGRGASAGI